MILILNVFLFVCLQIVKRILLFFLFIIWSIAWCVIYLFTPQKAAKIMIIAATNILYNCEKITFIDLEKIRLIIDKNYLKQKEN